MEMRDTNTVYTREKMIRKIAKMSKRDLNTARSVYDALEDAITELLLTVTTDHDVIIKLFEGISLEGTYVPEKMKVNNLTGKEIKVASKIKPKVNITRSFCDKLNAAVNV